MKNKILAISAFIIIIGIIVVAVLGFKVDFCYKQHNLIYIELGQDFNNKDIQTITDEVFPKQNVQIQSSGAYKDNLVIGVESITDEQKQNLSTKLNEKYGVETTVESIEVKNIPSYRLRDLAKIYLIPMAIAAVVALAYMLVRYKKIGIVKIASQFIVLNLLAEALYASIIAITRFPVNRLVMPGGITIFFVLVSFLAYSYEKQLKNEKE